MIFKHTILTCHIHTYSVCKDYPFLPRLPFQLVSLRSSVIGELLSPRLWGRSPEPPEPVLEMDIRDLEGLMTDGPSDLMGSFLDRWWSTLIMASFSMIWAWRFFILGQGGSEGKLLQDSTWVVSECPCCGSVCVHVCFEPNAWRQKLFTGNCWKKLTQASIKLNTFLFLWPERLNIHADS